MALNATHMARALGISRQAVDKCRAKGMPMTSVAEARAWRDAYLNPARIKRPPPGEDRAALLADVELLGRLADAQPTDEGLQLALLWALSELLTDEEFNTVRLPPRVWQRLVQAPAFGQAGSD